MCVFRSVLRNWRQSSLRYWVSTLDCLRGLLSAKGGSRSRHSRYAPVSTSAKCGSWKSSSALRWWCATTRRRSSTTSNVRNAPMPRFWLSRNFAQPSPTLTAEIPSLTSRRRWNCRGHSVGVVIEVTRAHSSSPGQPVSEVNEAGISYDIPISSPPSEFIQGIPQYPHIRQVWEHKVGNTTRKTCEI